jgi:transposase
MGGRRRRRVEPTDEWEQIELLCGWPEQRDYELIRPLVLFGVSADGRSRDTGVASGRTLQRRAKRFDAEGWSAKAIAGYLRVHRSTVHRVLRRWVEEGVDGLEDRPHGRPPGVRKVDLKAIEAVRRLQRNPNLGAFRVNAALAQVGIHLSPRTCGRILATNRALYGLEKPKGRPRRRRRYHSRPPAGTSSGPRTSVTSTTTSWAAGPTWSPSSRTTAARSSPAP